VKWKGSEFFEALGRFVIRRRWLCLTILVVAASLIFALLGPRDFYYSGRKISISFQPLSGGAFAEEGMFVNTGWDGPTGEFTHGDIFGLKLGKRMLRVDVVYDPIGAIKRDLPHTVPDLVAKLSSKNLQVRQWPAEALIKKGGAAGAAMPVFVELYGKGDEGMEGPIIELAKSAGAVVVPHLVAGLDNSNPKVRRKSAEALGEIGGDAKAAVGSLIQTLHDREANVAIVSALALRKIEKHDHGEVLVLDSLLKGADDEVRGGATWALGEFGEDAAKAVPALTVILDEKGEVVGLAARTLGLIGKPARGAIPKLIGLLDSANQQTVMFVAEALGHFGEDAKAAIPKLVTLAENREHTATAFTALSSIGEPAVPSLIGLYRNAKGSKFFVAKALMNQGPKAAAAVPILRKDLQSGKNGLVVVAAMTLGSIGEPARSALEDLLAILRNNEDRGVRVRVAEAIWRLDRNTNMVAPVMVAELANWSKDPNALRSQTSDNYGQSRQQVAANVLAEMGPAAREATPFLTVMRRSSFEEQRTAAEPALKAKAIGSE
jgi:HEAT repeat protein